MAQNRSRKIFVNLPVRDLNRSMEFFSRLGFEFDPQFCDEKAACMIVGDEAFVMLVTEPLFETFTNKDLGDRSRYTQGLIAISAKSRAEVDEMMKTALANGAEAASDPVDHGFMYYSSFYDLDGHHWEPLYMEPKSS